ncbi:MAG: ABC transporter substrate-binding protein, partial [Chloroflexota bacterium]
MWDRKKILISICFVLLLAFAAACGSSSEPVSEPEPAEDPVVEVEEAEPEEEEMEEEEAEAEEEMAEEEMASDEPILIGGVAILEGAFAALGEDSVRGIQMAIAEYGGEVAGHPIELLTESSDATPDVAVNAVRKLVEQDGVDIVVGPLSGDEGIAIKGYAKTQPGITFVNGVSGAQDATLRDPADNFFRFNTDGTQWMAGLGNYAFSDKGYAKVATVAEDYSFPYSQVGGFVLEYCQAGGAIDGQFWTPIGTTDYSSIVASIPDDVDAIYVALGGSDAVNFLRQYTEFGGTAPIIGGSITVDQTVLSSDGALLDAVIGTISAGPIADTNPSPEFRAFVDSYTSQFPDANTSPSLFAWGYYVNTLAVLQALESVDGDLSDGQAAFQAELAATVVDGPTGMIELDGNRQAIGNNYITEIVQQDDGSLISELVETVPNVNQTMGVETQTYLDLGAFDRENPSCGAIAEQFADGMPAAEAEEEMADGSEFGPLTIGGVAILEGAFAALGEDSVRGIQMAIAEYGGEVAGRPIELITESSDATPDVAVNAVRKLVEQDGVDLVVGPLSGDEGIAIKGYAKTQPG